jgi:hypothetical protein
MCIKYILKGWYKTMTQTEKLYYNFNYTNDNYLILCTISTYERTASGKSWQAKPQEVEKIVYKPRNYTNYITSIPFFNNFGDGAYCRATWGYTTPGYLPTRVISVSPYQQTKKVACFEFIPVERLTLNAGWRENFIIENARYFERFTQDSATYLKLITTEKDGKHAGVINLKNNQWVN